MSGAPGSSLDPILEVAAAEAHRLRLGAIELWDDALSALLGSEGAVEREDDLPMGISFTPRGELFLTPAAMAAATGVSEGHGHRSATRDDDSAEHLRTGGARLARRSEPRRRSCFHARLLVHTRRIAARSPAMRRWPTMHRTLLILGVSLLAGPALGNNELPPTACAPDEDVFFSCALQRPKGTPRPIQSLCGKKNEKEVVTLVVRRKEGKTTKELFKGSPFDFHLESNSSGAAHSTYVTYVDDTSVNQLVVDDFSGPPVWLQHGVGGRAVTQERCFRDPSSESIEAPGGIIDGSGRIPTPFITRNSQTEGALSSGLLTLLVGEASDRVPPGDFQVGERAKADTCRAGSHHL